MELEEKCISTENVFRGKLLDVNRDKVELSNGRTSVREWIDHLGASAVIPVFEDGSTILVRQYRYPARRTFLEVPAGKLDFPGEDPLKVAKRELEEETGWCAAQWLHLGSSYPCIGYSNEVIHFYLATDLRRGALNPGEGEILQAVRIDLDEALNMALNGGLDDMKTALAIRMAHEAVVQKNR